MAAGEDLDIWLLDGRVRAEPRMARGRGFPHLKRAGEARMVDVSDKPATARTATAAGRGSG